MNKPVEHGKVWRLAGPLIISNISIALLGMVDAAVVGHLPEAYYLGAVAVGAVVFDFIYWSMGFLRMGTTGVTAQAHGRNDNDDIRTKLSITVGIALLISIILLLVKKPLIDIALLLIGGSNEVKTYTLEYFNWRILGAPAALLNLGLTGWLLGMQNARATLYIAVTINVINIILDFVFVFFMDMDVRGVALASVIAQITGVILGVVIILRELNNHPGAWLPDKMMEKQQLKKLMLLNQDIFIRTLCLLFAFAFFTRQGAAQGDLVLAANSILMTFLMLIALGLDGFANAAEAMVGKAVGAESQAEFNGTILSAGIWSLIIALVFSLFYAMFGNVLINFMTDITAVRGLAYKYVTWIVFLPMISVWCFLLDGVFFGATRGKEMRNSMLFSTFIIYLPMWYLFRGMGNNGLWLALFCFFVARGLSLGVLYYLIEYRQGGFIKPQS